MHSSCSAPCACASKFVCALLGASASSIMHSNSLCETKTDEQECKKAKVISKRKISELIRLISTLTIAVVEEKKSLVSYLSFDAPLRA